MFELILVGGLGALVALVVVLAPVDQCARHGESESEDWLELDKWPRGGTVRIPSNADPQRSDGPFWQLFTWPKGSAGTVARCERVAERCDRA